MQNSKLSPPRRDPAFIKKIINVAGQFKIKKLSRRSRDTKLLPFAFCLLPSRRRRRGYIALIALLVVAAVGLTIGLAVSLAGIEEIQVSFGNSQSELAKSLASACIEDGLERLHNDWNNYSGSLSVDGNSCIINTVVNGGSAIVTAKGIVDIYSQKIEIQVDNNLEVITWQEE